MACPQLVPGPDENLGPQGENLRGGLLAVRFWSHDTSQRKLEPLPWESDLTIADLCREVVQANCGSLLQSSAFLLAHFADPLRALVIAKALQQMLLPRAGSEERQIMASVAIYGELPDSKSEANPGDRSLQMLDVVPPAHILVSEEVFVAARSGPDFVFETDATLSTNDKGESRRLYELCWTDKTTYRMLATMLKPEMAILPRSARYQTLAELGRGGMGVVYKAHDRVIDRIVALKTIALAAEEAHRASLIRRLKQEAKAAGNLDHPNIVTIYDIGEEEGVLYLSMQFVEGETLSAVLARKKSLPLAELLCYVDQICSAVGYAHRHGIVHRDLKPSNVMINARGTVKVLDFGIAKLGDAGTTEAGAILGTPDYMAPEQAAGKPVDSRSDIFSLGSMFYELFTGEKAFSASSVAAVLFKVITDEPVPPAVLQPGLPKRIGVAIQRAMAKSPEDRFQSCEAMWDAFRRETNPESKSLEHSAALEASTAMAELEPMATDESANQSLPQEPALAAAGHNVIRAILARVSFKLGAAASLAAMAAIILVFSTRLNNASPAISPGKAPMAITPANLAPAPTVQGVVVKSQDQAKPHDRPAAPEKEKPRTFRTASSGANSKDGRVATTSFPSGSAPSAPVAPAATESVNGFRASEIPDILARAEKLYGDGHYRDAITAYDNVLKLDPGNEIARSALNKAKMAMADSAHHR
jgi:serine/threonine protein kinase